MGFFLALNSLNFAEAARPFKLLSDQKLAEMFFSLGLQCKFSFRPYGYYLPMVGTTGTLLARRGAGGEREWCGTLLIIGDVYTMSCEHKLLSFSLK